MALNGEDPTDEILHGGTNSSKVWDPTVESTKVE